MSEHYYTAQPLSKHKPGQFKITLRGVELEFHTDAGVFSKSRIDTGTKLLIDGLRLTPEIQTVLDLGCGYGPIGLTVASLLPKATVYMGDINERAVELARMNARLNGLTNVEIRAGEGFTPFAGLTFDLIVTNPPIRAGKQVIYGMVDAAPTFLNDNGWFVAVVATKQGAKSFERKLEEVFGNVDEWEKGSGFRVIAAQKRNSLKV
ncbi:MAG TPA: methyltransferase [Bacillota bacterium]|nr:methyltransferase [Bacillota bacterium]HPT86763.1 methyltransferase [Bacillota bacterium]